MTSKTSHFSKQEKINPIPLVCIIYTFMPVPNLWDYMQVWSYIFVQRPKSWLLQQLYLHLNYVLASNAQGRIQNHLSNSIFGIKPYLQKYSHLPSAYKQPNKFPKNVFTTYMKQMDTVMWNKWIGIFLYRSEVFDWLVKSRKALNKNMTYCSLYVVRVKKLYGKTL